MRRQTHPARLGRWLLRLRAGDARRAEVEDDLVELFRLRLADRGPLYAQWRWLRDAASVKRPAWPQPRPPRRPVMAGLWQDIRIGARALLDQRRFAAIAIVILALGIGVTTTVFSVVNAVLLRALPYAEPDQLVAITGLYKSSARQAPAPTIALADVTKWRPLLTSFESIGAFAYTELPVRVGDRAFSPVTALMDPEFLAVLGTPLARGSFFPPGDSHDADRTVIISHALALEAFGGRDDVVGQTIDVDGDPYQVRGVLAADFQFPRSDVSYFTKPVDLLMLSAAMLGFPPTSQQWWGIGRLKPGVTLAHAETELQAVAEGVSREPGSGDVRSAQLASLAAETTKAAREPLLVVLAISIVLLLIACTNLMNLFLARGIGRMREMSIRRAIGGTTWQLLRLLLLESLLLAIAGGALGVWLASLAIRGIVAVSPVHLPVTHAIDIDGTVVGFALLLCVGTAIAAGLLPAIHVSGKTNEAVRSPGMRATAGRAVGRVQKTLCVTQIALGLALLASAGLLAHSLWRLDHVDSGFDVDHVLGFNLSIPGDVSQDDRARYYNAALEDIRTIPGVASAGFISFLPPELRAGVFMGLGIEGQPTPAPGDPPRRANTLITSAGYFDTMRMRIVRGRDFTDADTKGHPLVVTVNEAFARRYFPGQDPIGRHVGTGFDNLSPVREIVGVVADTHDRGALKAAYPTLYVPLTQFNLGYGAIAARITTPTEPIVQAIRDRLRALNPAVPLTDFQMLDDRLYESLREPRFYTLMAAGCALMAVLFVTFGLYGLVSYSVGRRTTELGIRMALGATRATILRMVLAQGLGMAIAGVALGLALAMAASRALRSQLFEVQPIDPPIFALAAASVIVITLVASYVPARRAGRVNPIAALRQE